MKKLYLAFFFLVYGISAPSQGTWAPIGDFAGTARYGTVGVTINNKAYTGLGYDGTYRADWWEYSPAGNTWTQKADFGGGPRHAASAFALGGKAYVACGLTSTIFNDVWEYDPASNSWLRKNDFPGGARYAATAATSGGKGYIGLGVVSGTGPFFNDWWEYDPASDMWTRKTDFPAAARTGASSFSIGSAIYVCAGSDVTTSSYYNDLWKFDPLHNSWSAMAALPAAPRSNGFAFTINAKGYFGAGTNFTSGALFNDFWKYDAGSNAWTQQTAFAGTAGWGAASFAIGNKGYVVTGRGSGNYYSRSAWEWCARPEKPLAVYGPTSICSGTSDQFNIAPVPGATSYSWTLPNGWSGSGNSTIITATAGQAGGTLTVCALDECGAGPVQYFTVSVDPSPPVPTITQNGAVLTSSAASGNQWYFNTTIIPGATGQHYTVTQNGNYTVQVSSNNGCTSMSAVYAYNSVGISPGGEENTMEIFPNPGKGVFTIRFSGEKMVAELLVYDHLGKIVLREELHPGTEAQQLINLSGFPSGVYLFEVRSGDKKLTGKVVLE